MFYLDNFISHRGYHDKTTPENSLAAFKKSIDAGFSIEIDVRLTKDDIPVVFHDEVLDRMTSANGKVSQYMLSSLKKLKLSDSEEIIPSLEEVLELVAGKVPLIIELKNNTKSYKLEEEVFKLLAEYLGEFTIQSFNPFSLQWIRDNYPNTVLGLLTTYEFGKEALNVSKKAIVRFMPLLPMIRPEYIGVNHRSFSSLQLSIIKTVSNAKIIYWTVDNKEDFKRLIKNSDNLIFEGFDPREL